MCRSTSAARCIGGTARNAPSTRSRSSPTTIDRRLLERIDRSAASLATVVVEQLVARDAVQPRERRFDAATLSKLAESRDERLLGQILSDRRAAGTTVQEVAVDPRQRVVVEAGERGGVGDGRGGHVLTRYVVACGPFPSV